MGWSLLPNYSSVSGIISRYVYFLYFQMFTFESAFKLERARATSDGIAGLRLVVNVSCGVFNTFYLRIFSSSPVKVSMDAIIS